MPSICAALLLSIPLSLIGDTTRTTESDVAVAVDSSRKVVIVAGGPYTIPAGRGGHDHASTGGHGDHASNGSHDEHHGGGGHDGHGSGAADDHGTHAVTPFQTFSWPVDGWLRGVKLRITDQDGQPLSRQLIHHINLINLDRRQLLYPAAERILAIGQETEDIHLPASIGIPITRDATIGLVIAWHNPGAEEIAGARVELAIEWLPTNTAPRPLDVLPVYLDVKYPVGQPVDFDLPAGQQEFTADFTMPIEGRIIAAGGHLHDYGVDIELLEVDGNGSKSIIKLPTTRDADGRVSAVARKYPGIRGNGIKLRKGHTYRLVGRYDNTTGKTLTRGAMIHLVLLFAPKNPADWPAVDLNEADFQLDLKNLRERRE
jgi:hypothetical protein